MFSQPPLTDEELRLNKVNKHYSSESRSAHPLNGQNASIKDLAGLQHPIRSQGLEMQVSIIDYRAFANFAGRFMDITPMASQRHAKEMTGYSHAASVQKLMGWISLSDDEREKLGLYLREHVKLVNDVFAKYGYTPSLSAINIPEGLAKYVPDARLVARTMAALSHIYVKAAERPLKKAEKESSKAYMSTRDRCKTCGTYDAVRGVLKRCASCKLSYYCSRECQVQDWELHKSECKEVQAILTKRVDEAEQSERSKTNRA